MTLSWQPSDPIYQLLDIVSALCCFFYPTNYHYTSAHDPEPAVSKAARGRARKKKKLRKGFFFVVGRLRRGPWKNHCRRDLAGEREVTLVPRLHRVITAGAAALCLFSTGCDTDGFDRRDAQSRGPRRASRGPWRGLCEGGWGGCECLTADMTENRLFRKDATARSLNKDIPTVAVSYAEGITEGKSKSSVRP